MSAVLDSTSFNPTLCGKCNNHHTQAQGCTFKVRPVDIQKIPTGRQEAITLIGKFFAGIMALGCGVSTAAAFVTLNLVSGGVLTFVLAGIIGVAGVAANWFIFKGAVPKVGNDLFGEELGQGLLEVEGGCETLTMNGQPTADKIFDLGFKSNAAYILANEIDGNGNKVEKLYYANKNRKSIVHIPLNAQQLESYKRFVTDLNVHTNVVNYQASKVITKITGHHPLSITRKIAMGLGVTAAASVGITFGALAYGSTFSLTAAFGFLSVISAGFPPIAAVLTVATFVCLSALMLKDIAELIKTDNIIEKLKGFVSDLVDVSPRAKLIERKKLPSVDELKSLNTESVYIRMVEETAPGQEVTTALYYFNRHQMKKPEKLAIDNLALVSSIKEGKLNFDQVKAISVATESKHKVRGQAATIAIRMISTVLTLAFIPLAVIGLFMTMKACAPGVKALLLKIPQASAAAVDAAAWAISLGLAVIGQVVFTINTVVKTINNAFRKSLSEKGFIKDSLDKAFDDFNNNKNPVIKFLAGARVFALISFALINAIGNGLISMVGAGKPGFLFYAGGAGGGINSASAGIDSVVNALAAEKEAAKKEFETKQFKAALNQQASNKLASDPNNKLPDNLGLGDSANSLSAGVSGKNPPEEVSLTINSGSQVSPPSPSRNHSSAASTTLRVMTETSTAKANTQDSPVSRSATSSIVDDDIAPEVPGSASHRAPNAVLFPVDNSSAFPSAQQESKNETPPPSPK